MKGVISIGANYGQEYEGYLADGYKYFIFFEPVKRTFNKLSRIMKDKDNVVLYNLALGNMTGQVQMFTETEHQGKSCSILEPKLHLTQYPDIEFDGKEIVDIDKLDNIKFNRDLYDHLHIDVQGYELEVLKGAVNTLNYIDTIQCEVYRDELYKGCPMWEEVYEFLAPLGFEIQSVKWIGYSWGNLFLKRDEGNN